MIEVKIIRFRISVIIKCALVKATDLFGNSSLGMVEYWGLALLCARAARRILE